MTLQIKNSTETLMSKPATSQTKHDAQQVVCQYVQAWYPHLDEAGQIAEVNELLDILGIKGR